MSAAVARGARGARVRRYIAGASVVIAATVASVAAVRASRAAPDPTPELTWTAGVSRTYALSWETKTEARAPGTERSPIGFRSDVKIDGELRVRSFGVVDGRTVLGVSFARIDDASAHALEHDLLPSRDLAKKTLEGFEAAVEVERSGAVRAVHVPADAPPLFTHLIGAVVDEMSMDLAGASGREWRAEGQGPNGRARVRMRRDESGKAITRTREHYDGLSALPFGAPAAAPQSLASEAAIALDEHGGLRAITDHESLRVEGGGDDRPALESSTRFALSQKAESRFDAAKLPDALARPARTAPGDTAVDGKGGDDDRAFLERRARGVTVESITADLKLRGALPQMGDGSWAWRASGYLTLHPESCAEIARAIEEKRLELNAAALALDLLASVGHAEAQAALRRAIDSLDAADERALLLQRIGFVKRPDAATLDFVEHEHESARAHGQLAVADAAAVTLGMLAFQVVERDRPRARAIADKLTMALYSERRAKGREALLFGLGNAGMQEDLAAIVAQVLDTEPVVRAAAAKAMRKLDGEDVHGALVSLVGDSDRFVQKAALLSLVRKTLTDDDLRGIERAVLARRIEHSNDTALIEVLVASHSPVATSTLRALLDDEDTASETRTRIARLLQAMD